MKKRKFAYQNQLSSNAPEDDVWCSCRPAIHRPWPQPSAADRSTSYFFLAPAANDMQMSLPFFFAVIIMIWKEEENQVSHVEKVAGQNAIQPSGRFNSTIMTIYWPNLIVFDKFNLAGQKSGQSDCTVKSRDFVCRVGTRTGAAVRWPLACWWLLPSVLMTLSPLKTFF